jgi:hypothetical protein
MAKAQGLALNPTKISGQCGRLLCCLAYEYETYNEMKKTLPKCGKKLQLESGQVEVISRDILAQKVTICSRGGVRTQLHIDELQQDIAKAEQVSTQTEEKPTEQRSQQKKHGNRPPRQRGKGAKPGQRKEQQQGNKPQQEHNQPQQKKVAGESSEQEKSKRRRRSPRRRPGRRAKPAETKSE